MGPSEPNKRHWAWGGGLALVASMTLAACGTPSSTTTTGDTADGTAATTLATAVEATLAEPTGHSSVVLTFDPPTGSEGESLYFTEMRFGGSYDVSSGRAEVTSTVRGADPGEPAPDGSAAWGPGGAPLQSWVESIVDPEGLTSQMIIDLPSRTIYGAPLDDGVEGLSGWMSEPISDWRSNAVYDPRGLDDLDAGRAFVRYLRAAADVRSRADGDLTRYDGVVRTADLPDPKPISYSEGETWATPEVPFTAWVDADGFVTRVELTMDGVDSELIPWDTSATVDGLASRPVGTVRISIEMSALGEPVTIDLPPADQVKTFEEMFPPPDLTDLIPPEERAEFCADWVTRAPSDDGFDATSDTWPAGGSDPWGAGVADPFAAMCDGLADAPPPR